MKAEALPDPGDTVTSGLVRSSAPFGIDPQKTDSVDADPADWPPLWADILAVRRGLPPRRLVQVADSGWSVVGACSAASAGLFDLCKPLLDARLRRGGAAWVIAQLGQSLDGCVATANGHSNFVGGAASLRHLHRLRALCDAVLVGAGTVAADDPQLTTRRVSGPHAVRVVLDPTARLDGRARLLHDGQAPTLWLCDARHAAAARSKLLRATGTAQDRTAAEVLAVADLIDTADPARAYHPDRAVAALSERGLQLLFVEGGGVTVSRFLAAGALHRLHLAISPVLIGNGRRGLQGPARASMADCPRPPVRTLALGPDMLWDLDLRGQALPRAGP